MDQFKGETTEKIDPFNQGEVKTWDAKNVDWGKTRRSQSNAVKQVEGTWGPIVAAATLGPALRTEPLATLIGTGAGTVGNYVVDKLSEAVTGNDFGTNVAMYTPLTPGLGEALNPGGLTYGTFVGNNMANRSRYFLNNKEPASYDLSKESLKALGKTAIEPFYKRPPTFFNGRRPDWYWEWAKEHGTESAENRFQNGVLWGQRRISEDEVPITMYKPNADGSVRMTDEGIGLQQYNVDFDKTALPQETQISEDLFTKGGVGGLHSNYTQLARKNGISIMQFQDEQKLNPQWLFADWFKRKFNINSNSTLGKIVDKAGGYPLDGLIGYKPFTIKQNYLHDGKTVSPILEDPCKGYQQNFIFGPIDDLTIDTPFSSFHFDKQN